MSSYSSNTTSYYSGVIPSGRTYYPIWDSFILPSATKNPKEFHGIPGYMNSLNSSCSATSYYSSIIPKKDYSIESKNAIFMGTTICISTGKSNYYGNLSRIDSSGRTSNTNWGGFWGSRTGQPVSAYLYGFTGYRNIPYSGRTGNNK